MATAEASSRLVTAVVPTYNSARTIGGCLAALLAQDHEDLRVVVVDNASSDGTPDQVRKNYPNVGVVELGRNSGYGAAVNVGAALGPDSHILVLNADAYLRRDALSAMLRALDTKPPVGVVGPRLLDPDGSLQPSAHSFPTLPRLLGEALMLDRLPGPGRRLDYHRRDYDHAQAETVDWVTGAVLLIRRDAWQATGGFDATYQLYVEEVDLQSRIRDAGYIVRLEPAAEAVHEGGKRPVAAARFVHSHDGFERYFERRQGRAAGRLARATLCLTAAARCAGWAYRARRNSDPERRAECEAWRRMFREVLRLSAPRVLTGRPVDPGGDAAG
jgi:GT2 family glycosyltransferase